MGEPTVQGIDWTRATVLTDEEFLASWDALALGRVPSDLELSFPVTPAEAEAEYTAALGELHRRGLADESGPGPELSESLRVLAEAPVALELRMSGGLVVLGAADGERGVLLVVDDAAEPGLYLLPVAGPRVAATLVRLAGPLEPGTLAPVTVPADVLDAARADVPDGGYWAFAERLVAHGVGEEQAHLLALMCTGITSAGQFGALVRRDGAERATPWVLAFHRSAAGDFVQLRRPSAPPGPAGADLGAHVTVGPATRAGLLARLDEMVADLVTGSSPAGPTPG